MTDSPPPGDSASASPEPGLFQELRRRKVIRTGLGYLVVAWLAIQVGATVAPQLNMPDWVPRLVTLLALLGLPVVLVLAWMFDFSREGIRLEPKGAGTKRVLTAAAILAAVAVGWFVRGGMPSGAGDNALGARSTAVLPFVNMSADKDNDYFSDGLTENLLHKLAQVGDLKVAARTSSFAFRGKQEDVRAIGKALGVATLVEGSVQRAGDTLRITAQLVRTIDGSHVWSQRYDRKLADVFAIQDEIAGAVTTALVGALMPEAKAAIAQGGTQNLAAYNQYARGLQQFAHYSFESLREAEQLFQQALAADPGYVDAMVALLRTWDNMANTGMINTAELEARAAPWLDRIEAHDPGNGALLGFRGRLAALHGERETAHQLYRRAIAAAPNDAALAQSYALFLRTQDPDAALAELDRVLQFDPANAILHIERAHVLRNLARLDESAAAARRAIDLDPNQPNAYGALADAARMTGDGAGAIAWMMAGHRVDPKDHEIPTTIAISLANTGEFAAADAWFDEALRIAPGHIFPQARRTQVPFVRGDWPALLEQGLAFGPREAENTKDSWFFALSNACVAGAMLGRAAEVRERLEQFKVMPRELTPAAFRAMDARYTPLSVRVNMVDAFPHCLFGSGGDDAQRRKDLLATYTDILGPDWAKPQGRWFIDGYLRGDRERMIAGLLPAPGRERELRDWSWLEAEAKVFRVADDPRLQGHFAAQHALYAEAKATLPRRLQEQNLQLLP